MNARNFFSPQDKDRIVNAVREAELNTSGEIRVHIENHCRSDVMHRAAFVFDKLGMSKTDLRNGVLFYLAVKDKKFAILGDSGINELAPDDFWEEIKGVMLELFREGKFAEGLARGIVMAGEELKQDFPYQADDKNELPDDISFG